jgi:hypothetical protein
MLVRFFVTAPALMSEQALLAAIQSCGVSPLRHVQTLYGRMVFVEVEDNEAGSLADLADHPNISVIPADSRGGRELQVLLETLIRKSA